MTNSFLPELVKTKIYKTGQTRGADDDIIYQNRVSRHSTVLIPFVEYEKCKSAPTDNGLYENGYIVLIKPEDFFNQTLPKELTLGENLLVFYETREQWIKYPINTGWKPAVSRKKPLGGEYVARVPATTSKDQDKIIEGFASSDLKGAGIRVYEYANTQTINDCKLQLELLFWSCFDINEYIKTLPNLKEEIEQYVKALKQEANKRRLFEIEKLIEARILNEDGHTICPLCLNLISSIGFGNKMKQAEGREVPDATVTEVSLFHIRELRMGEYNHRPYNLGWGHHHCNVVVKDIGIMPTLQWMKEVLERNSMFPK